MDTKSPPIYEFKTVRNNHRYSLTGSLVEGHPFAYVKRRKIQTESKYTGFKPYCKCGWKSTTWHVNKKLAEQEHTIHSVQISKTNPTLPLGQA